MPSSMASPAALLKVARVAMRGPGAAPRSSRASPLRFFPEIRTMPMPALPCPVAIAAMTSVSDGRPMAGSAGLSAGRQSALGARRGLVSPHHAPDLPLLQDRQDVVDEPVQDQPRGEEEEHHAEDQRHDH